jgi:NitT/TauT family transport system substrate-binding protein
MEESMTRTVRAIGAVLITLTCNAALAQSAGAPLAVKFRQSFIPSEQYIPEQVAIDKKYYEARGLRVEMLRSTSGGAATASLVAAGNDQFGVSAASDVIIARNKGLDLVAIGLNSPKDPTAIVSLASNPIRTPGEIRGKRIGAIAGSTAFALLQAFLKAQNIGERDVKLVLIGPGDLLSSVMGQRVDAICAFETTNVPAIRAAGGEPVSLRLFDYGLRGPGAVYIANGEFARGNPDAVARFMAATIRGWQEIQKDGAKEGLALLIKAYPELASQQAFLAQRWQFRDENDYNPYSKGKPVTADAFKFDPRTLETLNSAMVSAGVVKEGLDLQKAFSNEFVEAAQRLMK